VRVLIAIGVHRQEEAGAAGVVLNQARELEARGHIVECWFIEDVLERPARPERFESLVFAFRAARRISRERTRFDIANIHAPWGCAYGIWRKLLRAKDAPPYVMTMQGSEEQYAEAMREEHRKGRAWNFGWRNKIWHRLYHQTMYNISIRTADYGVVANREGTEYVLRKHRRDPERFSFIPNGVEERFFTARDYGATPPRLLYVGSWLDRKGVYYLAEAFGILARKMPSAELTVAGCMRAEEQVKSFFAPGCRSQVRVLPFVKREEMPAVYAAHDIFVFPSLVEGMPLTLLEAMASAMPVLTTAACGMADVVQDGFNGILIPPADAAALESASLRLCHDVNLRRRLGQAAQGTMRRYTWQSSASKLERVFVSALQNGNSRGGVECSPSG